MSDIDPEDEEEYEAQRREILEDAAETKQEYDKRHSEMLDAVQSGEDFQIEDYEWVNLGDLPIKVKTWFPGDTLDELMELEEAGSAQQGIKTTIAAFTKLTEKIGKESPATSREEIESFWMVYYEEWGDQGLKEAVTVVAGPAIDNSDEKKVAKSFRGSER